MSEQRNKLTSSPSIASVDPIVSAKELTALIRAHADETERGRRLAAPVVDALRCASLFTVGLLGFACGLFRSEHLRKGTDR